MNTITWEPTTKETFYEMLEVLPPAAWENDAFLVGEPFDHDAETGDPRYSAYRRRPGEQYETGSRPMTIQEFKNSYFN